VRRAPAEKKLGNPVKVSPPACHQRVERNDPEMETEAAMTRRWIPIFVGLAVLGATGYLVLTGEPGDGSDIGLLGLLGLLGHRHVAPRR
jgi:hypothetical protein